MPDIPSYRRKITPKPVGKAPLPVGAADVGAGAIGRGLRWLGQGIGDIGRSLFQIEQEKQRIRDNASLASANGDYDKAVADKIDEARRTTFASIEQFADFRKQAESDLDAIVQSSIGKMSTKAGQLFDNFAKSSKQNSLRQIESVVWPKEIEFGQADTLRQYSNKFEVLAGAGISVEDILKDPSLTIIETGMKPYWRTGELAKARDRILINALTNVERYGDAKKLAQETEALTATERPAELYKIAAAQATAEREAAEQLKQMREQTMIQMLADVWDGKLSDPQIITNALRNGWLDDSDAKYLREAILNPDPPETTNEAIIAVRYAIAGIAEGTETRESALKKVIEYTQQLSPTDGKAFIKEIFGEHDVKNAFWNRQAHEYMEKQIMEVATMTGILHGSGEQLALSAKALLAYDKAKKDAAAEKKPLKGKELLILAHEVMLPFRKRVKPMLPGERLPETLGPGPEDKTPLLRRSEEGKLVIDSMTKPKSVEEFLTVYKAIPDREARRRYYEKWADKVYK